MRILFVHHYFPGQFTRLAQHFLGEGKHDIIAFHRGVKDGRSNDPIPGIRMIEYGGEVVADRPDNHVLNGTELFVREAASLAICAAELRDSGWVPDIVYGHTGWGTGAFLHDIFPAARYVKYCEWFYNNTAESTEFLNPGRSFESRIMNSLLNLPVLADMARADLLIAPTEWQKSQFPAHMREAIEIAPDGVDLDIFKPDDRATVTLESGRMLTRTDRLVTYVARGADPFRGFKPFMEALSLLQARDPRIEALIVGDRKVYYGAGAGTDRHFHDITRTAGFDPARTHFLGTLDYATYRKVLQISSVHVYLTVPFVLSWSAFEAMATGCAIVGSDTAPVREFVTHGKNGLLAGFFDADDIAGQMEQALRGGAEIEAMRINARQTIRERWSAEVAIARHIELLDRTMAQPK